MVNLSSGVIRAANHFDNINHVSRLRVGKERLKTTNLIYANVYRRNILGIEGT